MTAVEQRREARPAVAGGDADLPATRYACAAAAHLLHLVPERLLAGYWAPATHVPALNPSSRIQGEGLPPVPFVPEVVHTDAWTVWVRDRVTGVAAPYLLGEQSVAGVAALAAGERPPAPFVPQVARNLRLARLLVEPGSLERHEAEQRARLRRARAIFEVAGFAAIDGLVPAPHVACLRRHYRTLVRTGRVPLGDGQSQLRFAMHNEDVARFFHHQLAGAVATIVGAPVKPSYCYFASYVGGAELPEHVDRAQCEYTLALLVDFEPEPAFDSPWPLRFRAGSRRVAVHQAIGEAVLFRGRDIPHSRPMLADGRTSTSIFFHYVPAEFTGRLD